MADKASANLVNGEGAIVAQAPSPEASAPIRKPNLGTLGDPHVFTCTSARELTGWSFKGAESVLRADVGTMTFHTVEGFILTARVVRVQTSTVQENGRLTGKGKVELDFRPEGTTAKSKTNLAISDSAKGWIDDVLGQWIAYRKANHYGIPLLKPKEQGASSGVED